MCTCEAAASGTGRAWTKAGCRICFEYRVIRKICVGKLKLVVEVVELSFIPELGILKFKAHALHTHDSIAFFLDEPLPDLSSLLLLQQLQLAHDAHSFYCAHDSNNSYLI